MKKNIAFYITLIRGLLAISLGAVLLFQPEKTRPILANFMGMFWLASGIISLRWSASGERAKRLGILAGAIGVVAGLGMLTRGLTNAWIRQDILFSLLGVLILLTGILHTFGGFRVADQKIRKWSLTTLLLGIFEIVLGIMLIVEPMGRSKFLYLAASIWALVGGFILISDAVRIRKASVESV
ncbi:MAG: DUF308 domain-containing protein [Anaerolineales bacterium]|nr:DUF308 domain-containing protein [Anaerolineales bacterium]